MLQPAGQTGNAVEFASVDDAAVDFIGQHDKIMADGQLRDLFQIRSAQHPAGRVGRRVQDQHARLGRDQAFQIVNIKRNLALYCRAQ